MAERVVDVKDRNLGRVASEIAHLLQGKDSPSFEQNKVIADKVIVKNPHLIKVSGDKFEGKLYYRHSGRPGHLKTTTYKAAFAKSPEWVIRNAVKGMLPKNRLQSKRMNMLEFESETKNDG